MSVKAHVAWIVKGGSRTEAALQQLGNDLRELQQKVNSLAIAFDGIAGADVERMEMSIAEMRNQLRAVTDDLGDRIGAMSELLNSTR